MATAVTARVTKQQLALLRELASRCIIFDGDKVVGVPAGFDIAEVARALAPEPGPMADAVLKAIKYVVNNSDLGSDTPNGGLELSLYYDPDEEEYVARMSAGEFSGHSTAPNFELLLLSLPWVNEDSGAACVGADGQLLCVGCEGTGLYGDESICEDCNGCKIDSRDANVTKDDAYP